VDPSVGSGSWSGPSSASPRISRRALLDAILAKPSERAALIGRLYVPGDRGEMAELLIDLEEDRLVALEVADALRESLR
jgi:hypothetical protein